MEKYINDQRQAAGSQEAAAGGRSKPSKGSSAKGFGA